MPTIVFIRHGETDWNAVGRFQGQQDIPLNARGRGQARRNGRTLLENLPQAAEYDFVASPLLRTRETMEIVRGSMGLDPDDYRVDPILKELTFGDWEGFTEAELKQNWPDGVVAREADKWGFTPPSGESYEMLSERIARWLESVDRPSVVVSHGGVCRVLLGLLQGLGPETTPMLDIRQDRFMIWNGRDVIWV
ncbi:histidine phosphatase family protein [Kaistia algarum]|uniref:histidine phosphatase family protein n=1 Tax=Kaistia algarum TaxID=2083279 RepID=UPI000CE72438|nr:histidine phosphatase family protein [Kaistia algarum]MCX5512424.1 histidine phosphatase family protein [Kaistia algarum]PPE80504.1 histidine phosphatase family protein [Kaistia algarum]